MIKKKSYYEKMKKKGIDLCSAENLAGFDDFLIERRDIIDNAFLTFMNQIIGTDNEWNAGIYGEPIEYAINTSGLHGIPICSPYYVAVEEQEDDRVPCYALKLREEEEDECQLDCESCPYIKKILNEKE